MGIRCSARDSRQGASHGLRRRHVIAISAPGYSSPINIPPVGSARTRPRSPILIGARARPRPRGHAPPTLGSRLATRLPRRCLSLEKSGLGHRRPNPENPRVGCEGGGRRRLRGTGPVPAPARTVIGSAWRIAAVTLPEQRSNRPGQPGDRARPDEERGQGDQPRLPDQQSQPGTDDAEDEVAGGMLVGEPVRGVFHYDSAFNLATSSARRSSR